MWYLKYNNSSKTTHLLGSGWNRWVTAIIIDYCWHYCHRVQRFQGQHRQQIQDTLTHNTSYLNSSWLLWGGVGREAGTSTLLGPCAMALANRSSCGLKGSWNCFGPRVLVTETQARTGWTSDPVDLVTNMVVSLTSNHISTESIAKAMESQTIISQYKLKEKRSYIRIYTTLV